MLLTTGAIALSRKVADERRKKRELRQGRLKVGDSDVAKRAFASPASTTSLHNGEGADIDRSATGPKFEDPDEVTAESSDDDDDYNYDDREMMSARPEIHDVRHASQVNVTSPAQSEHPQIYPAAGSSDFPSDQRSLDESATSAMPPPYSALARAQSSASAASTSMPPTTLGTTTLSNSDAAALSMRTTNSHGTHAIRIKTIGSDLKSGFPYLDALFDLHVHPEKWAAFTQQVIDATKLSASDQGRLWASATAVALTGMLGTSVLVGRTLNRSLQEKKVKAGLLDMSDGGLGETLQLWNDEYFRPRGLYVHLELSESAMKHPDQKSTTLRKGVLLYSSREDRDRKREERKFVIVVTKLDEDGKPREALRELELAEQEKEDGSDEELVERSQELDGSGLVEIGSSDVPDDPHAAELPGDTVLPPVELAANEPWLIDKAPLPPSDYVEVEGDNTFLLENTHLRDDDASNAYEERIINSHHVVRGEDLEPEARLNAQRQNEAPPAPRIAEHEHVT